jgi:maleylacetoacetate isomerase
MKLHSYFRSSASFRVRIALNLKGIAYETISEHLVKNGGAQFSAEFTALNAQQLIPVLEADGELLTQSLAIMEWLEETYPSPNNIALMPADALGRARVRALMLAVACEIHPINNLRVLRYLTQTLKVSEEAKDAWYRHWVELGLSQLEASLAASPHTGKFCHGDTPTLADCCLVPQVFNARRFNSDIEGLKHVIGITERCMALPAFQAAQPSAQPDAE